MLELKNITYQPQTAKEKIIDEVNITVNKNEIILIEGESGSGKTTLLEIISGLIDPQQGNILWENKILKARQRRWLCGIVFQFPERFFLGTTIGRELKFGYKSVKEISLKKVLDKVGLSKINLKTPPEKLSGGQQRRLAVATQLIRKPNIIVLDEPTAGLDWSMKTDVKNLVNRLRSEITFIIVTHEPELFQELISKRFLLYKGKLKLIGGKY